jgi:tetratricopeptide (TPR) repeat protein
MQAAVRLRIRSRLGSWSARALARWLPDLSAEDIDDVARFGVKVAKRFPAAVGPAGPFEPVVQALWEKGRYAEAVSYLERDVEIRRELGDRKGEVLVLCWLGLAHWHAGDLDEALRQYELALSLAQESSEAADEPIIRRNIGRVHEHRGEPHVALEWLESAFSIFHDLGDSRQQEATREDIERVTRETQ